MRWLAITGTIVVLILVSALAAIGWVVGTEAGLHWAAAKVPGLEHEGLHGRLAGEVSFERLRYAAEGVRIEARKGMLRAHLAALVAGRLTIEPLRAAALQIEIDDAKTDARSGGPPRLPLRVNLAHVAIEAIELRRGEATYLLRSVELEHARLGPDLSLSGSFVWPHERYATRGKLHLRGTLERIEAQLVADVAGIAAEARALLAPFAAERLPSLEARAGPIDLARFVDAAPHTALDATLHASLSANGTLSGTLSAANASPGPIDADRLPVSAAQFRFATDFATATLADIRATLGGGGRLSGDARVGSNHVEAKLVAAAVDLRSIHSRLRRTALHGPLELELAGERQFARGSLTQPGIGLTAEIVRRGETLHVRELRALIEGGEVSGTGELVPSTMAFDARLAVARFNPAALGDYPAGSLNGEFIAKGALKDFHLTWRLAESTLYEHAFQSAGAARIAGTRVTQADADLRLGANRLTARGGFGRPGDELAFTLEAPRLEELAPLAGRLRASGTLTGPLDNPRARIAASAEDLVVGELQLATVTANITGTLGSHEAGIAATVPQYALDVTARLRGGWSGERGWSGEIRSLANAGEYPLELVAPAALRLAPGRVELGRFDAKLAQGRILVREAAWTPTRLASSGEFAGLPAQWLVLAGGLDERVSTTMLLDGEWQLAKAKDLEGFVRVRRVSGDVALAGEPPIELGLERAVLEARFANGRASGQIDAQSRVARLSAQGEVLPALAVKGKVAFAELSALAKPFLENGRVDGRFSAELSLTGTLAAPVFHGTLAGEALSFDYPPYGIALKDGTLAATLEGDRLRLDKLEVRAGEGRFIASGMLPLGRTGSARVQWRAERLGVLDRPDMRLVVTGAGEATYDGERASLTGELRADRGRFEFARDKLPKLSDDVVIVGETKIVRPPAKGKMLLPVALDLRLDLGDELVVQGYGYDGKLAGLIDLATSKAGELRAYGRLTAVHATFMAYGQQLEVDPGVLIFDGPLDNPSLQITAWRRNQAVEAGVQVTGTARAPSVNLVSQPPVPEGERLSWLVLGRPPSGATQADLGLLQAAAGALLAGGDSVPLDRRIARRFGLDELTLRGSGELTGQVVAIGKRLSDRLYISYEQGIGAVASNLVKLDYALGRRWTLRAETGSSSGGGLFYRYSWD